MTVLVAVVDAAGEVVGQCDARCYNARHKKCTCVCGGENHGKGRTKAEDNTRNRDWSGAAVTTTGQPIGRVRFHRSTACEPLFPAHPELERTPDAPAH